MIGGIYNINRDFSSAINAENNSLIFSPCALSLGYSMREFVLAVKEKPSSLACWIFDYCFVLTKSQHSDYFGSIKIAENMSKRVCNVNKIVYFHNPWRSRKSLLVIFVGKKLPLTPLTRMLDFWTYFTNQCNTEQYRASNYIKHIFPSVVINTLT